jgi:hypothetical protein
MSIDELKGNYSPMELVIFDALRKTESATTESLLRKVYSPRKGREPPFHASIVVNRAVVTLGMKLKRYREEYRLTRRRPPNQRLIENRLEKVKTDKTDKGDKADKADKTRELAHEKA